MNRMLSLVLLLVLTFSACSKPALKSDTGTQSSPVTSDSSAKETDSRPKTPIVEPIAVNADGSMNDFKSTDKEIFDTDQIHFTTNLKDWKKISDEEGIQTFEKIAANNNVNVVAFRGEAIIPAYLTKIATVLNTPGIRKEWIDSLVETRGIEQVSDFDRIEYNHTGVPWPFQDRDFVYRAKVQVQQTPPTMLITMKSMVDAREPEHKGIVRGEIIYSYYYMKQLAGVRATKVVVEMALDPKGAIPKWLVTLSQKKWPYNTLLALKKVSQREDLVVSNEIAEYFKRKPTTAKKVRKTGGKQ